MKTKYYMASHGGFMVNWSGKTKCDALIATDYKDPPIIMVKKNEKRTQVQRER